MSFNDLERGFNQNSTLARESGGASSSGAQVDVQLRSLSTKVATHIFRINSNVSGIQKLLDLIGTSRDAPAIRTKLHDLLEATREFVKSSASDVRELASWKLAEHQVQPRIEQQKVSREYASAIQSFQRVSRESAQRQKQFVERAKTVAAESVVPHDGETDGVELSETSTSRQQQQEQQQLLQPSPDLVDEAELDYQDTLIAQREEEIREIETGIQELNEIFRDLGTIVTEQGGLVDNIESNVNSVQRDTRGAVTELRQAHEYQRKAGKRMLCLLMVFCIVLAIVLLAVLA